MFLMKIFICTLSLYLVAAADLLPTVKVYFSENDFVTDSPWGPDKARELGELIAGVEYSPQYIYQRMVTLKNPAGNKSARIRIVAQVESGTIHYLRVRNAPNSFAQVIESSVELPKASFNVELPPNGKYTVLYVVLATYKYSV